MKKKSFLFIAFVVLLLVIVVFVYFNQKPKNQKTANVTYNPVSEQWEDTEKTPVITLEEINQLENTDGSRNHSVVRGYFENYSEETGILTIRAIIPFTYYTQYQTVEVKTAPYQTVFCLPLQITDPNTQEVFPIWALTFPVMDGETLEIDFAQETTFDQVLAKAHEGTYLIAQLTQDLQTEATNYITKLFVAGICD